LADEDEEPLLIPEIFIERCMKSFPDLTRDEIVKLIQEWMASQEGRDAFVVMMMEEDAWPGEDPGWLLGPLSDPGPG
jgi:hypothetical protein